MEDLKSELKELKTMMLELVETNKRLIERLDIQEKKPMVLSGNATTGPFQNEMSSWIRTAIGNLLVENIEWDFDISLKDPKNIFVTNKVLEFVGTQISSKTRVPWTHSVSHRELTSKINLVFRRRKIAVNTPDDKKSVQRKKNVRKTRRVTKSKHRKQVLAHEVYGRLMRERFGADIDKLVIEQLQSDEESTDSEMGQGEKSRRLRVIRPSWRSRKAVEAFIKFDEYDIAIRKNAEKEKEVRVLGRKKLVDVKQKYLDSAPSWAKVFNTF